uniref:(+)RNA virus helicase C-terminal domain-containing protein n=1 Tax=Homalodisca liturata TaxID=320908 RepID=A0A1B6HAQ2_9HEMI
MLICPNGITNLQINSGQYKILVFKQSEKLELSKMGYNISTIHEYQRRQVENIIVIRTAKYKDEIYDSLPHCLVAITRHTGPFKYITPTADDLLSKWIRKINGRNQEVQQSTPETHQISAIVHPKKISPPTGSNFSSNLQSTVFPDIHRYEDGSYVELPAYLKRPRPIISTKKPYSVEEENEVISIGETVSTLNTDILSIRTKINAENQGNQKNKVDQRVDLVQKAPNSSHFLAQAKRKKVKLKQTQLFPTRTFINSKLTKRNPDKVNL